MASLALFIFCGPSRVCPPSLGRFSFALFVFQGACEGAASRAVLGCTRRPGDAVSAAHAVPSSAAQLARVSRHWPLSSRPAASGPGRLAGCGTISAEGVGGGQFGARRRNFGAGASDWESTTSGADQRRPNCPLLYTALYSMPEMVPQAAGPSQGA